MKPCNTCRYKGCNLIVAIFMSAGEQNCNSPQARIDPATGKPVKVACYIQRLYGGCGGSGKWHSDYEDAVDTASEQQ